MTGKDDKAARLAAALRDNLKRRKSQARGKESVPAKAGTQSGEADTSSQSER